MLQQFFPVATMTNTTPVVRQKKAIQAGTMKNKKIISAFIGVLGALLMQPAQAEVTGTVNVINANTVEMQGQYIRLFGVDALNINQVCRTKEARLWPCGRQAALALRQAIGGAPLRCEPLTRNSSGHIVAVCRKSGEDVNAWMVARGWAVADRTSSYDYLGAEQSAQSAGAGIWSSEFVMPAQWRNGKRLAAANKDGTAPAATRPAPTEDWGPVPLNNGP
jgi:endonuclease YncB( thermonuclease family)